MNLHIFSLSSLNNRYTLPLPQHKFFLCIYHVVSKFPCRYLFTCLFPKNMNPLMEFFETSFFTSFSDFTASFSSFQISHSSITFLTSILHSFLGFFSFFFSFSFLFFSASSFFSFSFCFYHPDFPCCGLHCFPHSSGYHVIFTSPVL